MRRRPPWACARLATIALGLGVALAPVAARAATTWERIEARPVTVADPLAAVASLPQLARVELARPRWAARSSRGGVVVVAQQLAGLPVLGRGAAVGVDASGRPTWIRSTLASDLDRARLAPLVLDRDAAIARALTVTVPRLGEATGARLAVLPPGGGAPAALVWVVDARTDRGGARVLVDAADGAIRGVTPLGREVLGRVRAEDAEATPDPIDVELAEIDAADELRLVGGGGAFRVHQYVAGSILEGYEVDDSLGPSDGTDFLFDPPSDDATTDDPFVLVNLFHHVEVARSFYRDDLGVSLDGDDFQLMVIGNGLESGEPLLNAFFTPLEDGPAPNLLLFGQGEIDFGGDADVIQHEFFHYVSHRAVGYNLGYLGVTEHGLTLHSASIDEGLADYFAATVRDDPRIGEATLGRYGAARDLSDAGKRCPDDLVAEPHADGEVVGSWAWSVREAVGAEVADRLLWEATASLPAGAVFADLARAAEAAAEAMRDDGALSPEGVEAVRALGEARGLHACDLAVALTPGEPRRSVLLGLDAMGWLLGVSCEDAATAGAAGQSLFHHSITTDAEDEALAFLVGFEGGYVDGEATLYVRRDAPVEFTSSDDGFPTPSVYDLAATASGARIELVVDDASAPALVAGGTYYAVVVNRACDSAWMTIAAGPDASALGVGQRQEITEAEIREPNCGCRVPGAGGGRAGIAVAVASLLVAAARRRARTRGA